jgi:hypothetical protein
MDKYNTQLRLLGKKVMQLREAIEASFDPYNPNQSSHFQKQASYVAITLRQLQAAVPADAFMLAIHPRDKIYQNPAVVPQILKYPDNDIRIPESSLLLKDSDFYESLESFAIEAVTFSGESIETAIESVEEKKRVNLQKIPESLISRLYQKLSSDRISLGFHVLSLVCHESSLSCLSFTSFRRRDGSLLGGLR